MQANNPPSPAPADERANGVLRPVDADALALGHGLLRGSATGSLAWLEPEQQWPAASLVTVATMPDGNPIILISSLSGHTRALQANPHCGLLLSRNGAGDPLAHPRISLQARARFLEHASAEAQCARRRFLNRHHKAARYADFGDFSFVVLELSHASLNGGFGKAYELTAAQLTLDAAQLGDFAQAQQAEQAALEHMNQDHSDAVRAYAKAAGAADSPDWRLTGIDPTGIDLIDRGQALRIPFTPPLEGVAEIRPRLVAMAQAVRQSKP